MTQLLLPIVSQITVYTDEYGKFFAEITLQDGCVYWSETYASTNEAMQHGVDILRERTL